MTSLNQQIAQAKNCPEKDWAGDLAVAMPLFWEIDGSPEIMKDRRKGTSYVSWWQYGFGWRDVEASNDPQSLATAICEVWLMWKGLK